MLWFHNLSFRLKLLLPLGAVIMIALVVSLLNIGSLTSITQQTQNLTQLYLPAVQLVLEADRDLHQALIAERALLQEKPGSEAFAGYQGSRKENLGQVHARMQDVGDFELGPRVDRLVTTFFAQLKDWEAASRAVESAALGASGDEVALSFGKGELAFDRARKNLNKLSELLHAEAQALGTAVEAHAQEVRFSQILGNGVMLVLLATIAILLPIMVTRSINAIRARVDDIAQGEGDLTRRLDVSSRDELGQLSASFNGFLEKLHRTIGDMAGYTREVAAASGQLSAIAAGNNRLVDEQHGSIDSVVTAANEMSSAIQDVARSTAEAATESQSATRHSESGKRQVQQTIGAMTGLRESVEDASTVVAKLADDAGQIAAVLGVIRAIAEQTNLLALNAAIEAARAGEQGRGFAVVADEVRTLANRTQQSTRDIEDTIGRLQSGVSGAVAAMQEGSRKADSTLAEARQTEAFLDAIAQSVTRINDMGTQIASAAEQQSAVTEDINRNMVAIGDQSRQVATGASQTSSASAELARLATQLQGVAGQFRV